MPGFAFSVSEATGCGQFYLTHYGAEIVTGGVAWGAGASDMLWCWLRDYYDYLAPWVPGKVVGLSPLQAQYQARYGPGNYVPNVFIQYWSMRVMAYTAGLLFLVSLWGLWLTRRKKLAASRWFLLAGTWAVVLPFLMNTAGWLLTESGRQPWIVQGIMLTRNGISPSVSTTAL